MTVDFLINKCQDKIGYILSEISDLPTFVHGLTLDTKNVQASLRELEIDDKDPDSIMQGEVEDMMLSIKRIESILEEVRTGVSDIIALSGWSLRWDDSRLPPAWVVEGPCSDDEDEDV